MFSQRGNRCSLSCADVPHYRDLWPEERMVLLLCGMTALSAVSRPTPSKDQSWLQAPKVGKGHLVWLLSSCLYASSFISFSTRSWNVLSQVVFFFFFFLTRCCNSCSRQGCCWRTTPPFVPYLWATATFWWGLRTGRSWKWTRAAPSLF